MKGLWQSISAHYKNSEECDEKKKDYTSAQQKQWDTILHLTIQNNSWNHFALIRTEKGDFHTQNIASVGTHFKDREKFNADNIG